MNQLRNVTEKKCIYFDRILAESKNSQRFAYN